MFLMRRIILHIQAFLYPVLIRLFYYPNYSQYTGKEYVLMKALHNAVNSLHHAAFFGSLEWCGQNKIQGTSYNSNFLSYVIGLRLMYQLSQ